MPINGRYYQRPLFARDHINKQHAMDKVEGKGEKFCAREMFEYFSCSQRNRNNIDSCRGEADAIRRCMNKTFKDRTAKQIPLRTQQFLKLRGMVNKMKHLK